MNATETKTKIVNKCWLENRIAELNEWLKVHTEVHPQKWQNEHNRNYYVNKLIELEENGFKMIQI